MTRNRRLRTKYKGEYAYGERIANRLHVSESNLAVIRACRSTIKVQDRRKRSLHDARHALYLGAISAHKANIALFRRYRF